MRELQGYPGCPGAALFGAVQQVEPNAIATALPAAIAGRRDCIAKLKGNSLPITANSKPRATTSKPRPTFLTKSASRPKRFEGTPSSVFSTKASQADGHSTWRLPDMRKRNHGGCILGPKFERGNEVLSPANCELLQLSRRRLGLMNDAIGQ